MWGFTFITFKIKITISQSAKFHRNYQIGHSPIFNFVVTFKCGTFQT